MARLVYSERAKKDIRGLDPVVRRRLDKTLLRLSANPLRYGERLKDSTIGDFRFRVGDWRVIFDLKIDILYVHRVGHRREIYR